MTVPKLILFYIFAIIIFVAYFLYIGKIYKEQFVVKPLTFITNKDTIFLITQNLYCYDNIIQVILEKGIGVSLIGAVLPVDWKKKIIDLIRSTNEGSTDEFALGINNGKLVSDKFQNNTNSPQNEIVIELYENKILNKDTRPKNNGKYYILDGDIVSLKINANTYIGSNSETSIILKPDLTEQPSIETLNPSNNFAWVIKIDRYFSENRFDNKIANCACVLLEPYNPSSFTISRLNTNCDIATQTAKIVDEVTTFLTEKCAVAGLLELVKPFIPPSNKPDCTFENLVNIVQDTPRNRSIDLNACTECYHWQIRRK